MTYLRSILPLASTGSVLGLIMLLSISCAPRQPYYQQNRYGQPTYGYGQQAPQQQQQPYGGGGYYQQQQRPSYGQTAFRYGQKGVQAMKNLPGKMAGLFRGNRGDGSFWYADQVQGKPTIQIHLGEQMVYLFKGGRLAGGSPISSGQEGYDTMPGWYKVIEKDIDHKSSLYGDYEDMYGNVIMKDIDNRKDPKPPGTRFEGAKMYYFMRIYGGVGMHQGYLPGYAASHGCIRLPQHMAERFYHVTPMGTPVLVKP